MASLIEELQRREAAARHEVDELRSEIARLSERLARAEERLSRLEIRETAAEILGGAGTDEATAGREVEPTADPAPVSSRLPWRVAGRGGDGAAVPAGPCAVGAAAFRDLLEVLAAAGGRCGPGESPPRPG